MSLDDTLVFSAISDWPIRVRSSCFCTQVRASLSIPTDGSMFILEASLIWVLIALIVTSISSKLFFRLLFLSLLCLVEYLSLRRMKYTNDCSDACTHVMKDLLFLTSSVRKCTPGHSTSNISILWGEVSVCEGVGDTGPEDELGSPGERGHVAPVEGMNFKLTVDL